MTDQPRRVTVDDVADAFELDDAERAYLHRLADLNRQYEAARRDLTAQFTEALLDHMARVVHGLAIELGDDGSITVHRPGEPPVTLDAPE